MTSNIGQTIQFYMRASAGAIIVIAAVWAAKPLYHRNHAEFRRRASVWILLPEAVALMWLQSSSIKVTEHAVRAAFKYRAMQQFAHATRILPEYWEVLLAYLIMPPVLWWLNMQLLTWQDVNGIYYNFRANRSGGKEGGRSGLEQSEKQ